MNFNEKQKEIIEKYAEQISAIAVANKVDKGIAFDMFKKNVTKNAKYPYKTYKEAEEQAKKDFEELHEIAKQEA